MAKGQPIGNCPGCGHELKRMGHVLETIPKYRYQCVNQLCSYYLKKWFNRHGEPR